MVSEKQWSILNISLLFVGFVLTLTLFDVSVPTWGQALSSFDSEPAQCLVSSSVGENILDLDRCCLDVRARTTCSAASLVFDGVRYTMSCDASDFSYYLTTRGYTYCEQQPYW